MEWKESNLVQKIDTGEFIDMILEYDYANVPNVPNFNIEGIKICYGHVEVELSIPE